MLPGFHLQILRRKPRSAQQKLAKKMALLKQKSFKQIGELSAWVHRYLGSGQIDPQMENSLLAQLQDAQELQKFVNHVQAQSGKRSTR